MKVLLSCGKDSPNFCFTLTDTETNEDIQFVQTDWEYPSLATSLGWSLQDLQLCRKCRKSLPEPEDEFEDEDIQCENCRRKKGNTPCEHDTTDGTVTCKECGATASEFIAAAYDWLYENDGKTFEYSC